MIHTVIIDDEAKARKVLRHALIEIDAPVSIVGEAASVKEGVASIERYAPQLVFLDVEMQDGTGFDLLERLDTIDFSVIFTTAYSQYAIQAFRFSAVDYLLKPIDLTQLSEALQKVRSRWGTDALYPKQLYNLLHNMRRDAHEQCLAIVGGATIDFVQMGDILYCEADGGYTVLHLTGGQTLLSSKALNHFERTLPGDQFIRVNRNYLLHRRYIRQYRSTGETGLVTMTDGERVEVSRRKKHAFLDFIRE